ncbi:MAG: hypothetical protein VXY00_02300 [Candidatus Latescibacterota bacterium]|nr:hypothetical protein [Candidatus Latescibacterota bacterium]
MRCRIAQRSRPQFSGRGIHPQWLDAGRAVTRIGGAAELQRDRALAAGFPLSRRRSSESAEVA